MKKPEIDLTDKWAENITVGDMYPYEVAEAYSDVIDIGIRILHKLQSETESVTAIEQWDLEQALRKAGCTDD